jgi:hypothetical protein
MIPMGSYCPEPIDLSRDANVAVYPNRSMKLPGDFSVFAAHVMPLIEAGKFQRALIRKLPQIIDQNARLLEIGAGVGFLGGHLASIRPDLDITLHEDSPALRQMLAVVLMISELPFNNRFRLVEEPLSADVGTIALDLIRRVKPKVLVIGDPRFSATVLAKILPAPNIEQLFLYDRMIEANHSSMPEIVDLIVQNGFAVEDGIESTTFHGFRRVRNPDGQESPVRAS